MLPRMILTVSIVLLTNVGNPLRADEEPRWIKVTGTGESTATPDLATISIGVETEATTPGAALSDNADRMNAVMTRLKEAGLEERDLQTSQLGVWPIHPDRSVSKLEPNEAGYRASNQLTVTVRHLDRLGETLDWAVSDGANRISGPSFSVAEPAQYYQRARDAAIADAMAKAERYTAAAGVTLGPVMRIDESDTGPGLARQVRAEAMAAATPIAAGEASFSARITMMFEIEEASETETQPETESVLETEGGAAETENVEETEETPAAQKLSEAVETPVPDDASAITAEPAAEEVSEVESMPAADAIPEADDSLDNEKEPVVN